VVNDKRYVVEHNVNEKYTGSAEAFCRRYATELGLKDDNMIECVEPIASIVEQSYESNIKSNSSEVGRAKKPDAVEPENYVITLSVNDKLYDISLQGNDASVLYTAKNFCEANAKDIGVTEDIFSKCVESVATYLRSSVQNLQNPTPEKDDIITAPLRLAGITYQVRFRADITSINSTASSFCRQEGVAAGVTEANLEDCIGLISTYLLNVIKGRGINITSDIESTSNAPELRLFTVTFTIEGKLYSLSYAPGSSTEVAASEFCQREGPGFRISSENMISCINPVSRYIADSYRKSLETEAGNLSTESESPSTLSQAQAPSIPPEPALDKLTTEPDLDESLQVTLRIQDQDYVIPLHGGVSVEVTARAFCLKEGATLGITEENLDNCVDPVAKYLTEAYMRSRVEKRAKAAAEAVTSPPPPPRSISVGFSIQGKKYTIEHRLGASPREASSVFCAENKKQLSITDETFEDCVDSLAKYVEQAERDQVEAAIPKTQAERDDEASRFAATLTVTLRIGNAEFEVLHRMEASPMVTARAFCLREGSALGISEATLSNCADPVADYIAKAVVLERTRLESEKEKSVEQEGILRPSTYAGVEGVLSFPIIIDGVEYSVKHDVQQPLEISASAFCRDMTTTLAMSESAFANCVDAVFGYIDNSLKTRTA